MGRFEKIKNAIARKLRRTKVPKKYQRKYGTRYDKQEAEEAASAIAASIGRRKYGKRKFQEMAKKGRK